MDITIRTDDLRGAQVIALLEQHLSLMVSTSPPGSVHALDLDELRSPQVTAWTAWQGNTIMGCGALKEFTPLNGEIKSMHTAAAFRGQGLGSSVLKHIICEARRRGYRQLSLETGSMIEFAPARAMYERHGFSYCAPFADYVEDVNSAFMTRAL